jgi:hypothetical protein
LNSSKYAPSQADCAVQQEIRMSTKDISRSAVEGGRYNYNKHERNESHRHERARTKVWLDQIRFDDEAAEGSDPVPRNKVAKGFTDNLGPCYGWLASHCGERWDDVRSKLAGTFDTRKLSAWHIVNQHMLTEVEGAGTTSDAFTRYRSQRFWIDDDGLLQDRGKRYYRRSTKPDYTGPSEAAVLAYADGRKVTSSFHAGAAIWWALPGEGKWEACKAFRGRCSIHKDQHRRTETTSKTLIDIYEAPGMRNLGANGWWRTYAVEHFVETTWRTHKKLTKSEVKWWETISYEIRRLVTI